MSAPSGVETAFSSEKAHEAPSQIPVTAIGGDASPDRIAGLDSVRFVCALIVTVQHLQLLPTRPLGQNFHGLSKIAVGIYNMLFPGVAAVIVFFLISGFCIHLPAARGKRMNAGAFYVRRFVRVFLPAAVAYALYGLVNGELRSPTEMIFWSVVCEVIYYLLYPLILFARRQLGWGPLLGLSAVMAVAVLVLDSHNLTREYPSLHWLTWIVGLPCWLLGCWLAENYSRFPAQSAWRMRFLRAGIYMLAVAFNMVHAHTHTLLLSEAVVLNLFALPAVLWLGCEIVYARTHRPAEMLEQGGGWSYSLYLIHPFASNVLALCGLGWVADRAGTHFLLIPVALAISYLFFVVVERPFHKLAIRAGRALAPKAGLAAV